MSSIDFSQELCVAGEGDTSFIMPDNSDKTNGNDNNDITPSHSQMQFSDNFLRLVWCVCKVAASV